MVERITEGIVTEGRDPASRLRDLRGSVTPAEAGGVEPDTAKPDALKPHVLIWMLLAVGNGLAGRPETRNNRP